MVLFKPLLIFVDLKRLFDLGMKMSELNQNITIKQFERQEKVQEYLKEVKRYAKEKGYPVGISYEYILKLSYRGLKRDNVWKFPFKMLLKSHFSLFN